MKQAIIDKEPEVIECTVMQHGVIEIEGLKYLAAPLATLAGQRVWVAYDFGHTDMEVDVYVDGEFYSVALLRRGHNDKYLHSQLRTQKPFIEARNEHVRQLLALGWCEMQPGSYVVINHTSIYLN